MMQTIHVFLSDLSPLTLLLAAVFGGGVCAAVQIILDLTKLTPARILVALVSVGTLIYAVGLYEPLFSLFGEGIALPLCGFGASIARGVREAVNTDGIIGILSGGLSATAAGISLALLLGLLFSLICRGRAKRMSRRK